MRLITRLPLHPLLLAAYAVLFLYATNISEVVPADMSDPLLIALAFAAVALGICALLYRDPRRGALLASAIVVVVLFFGHLANTRALAELHELAQLAIAGGFLLMAAIYARVARGSISAVTAALNGFGIVLVSMALFTIVPFETDRVARASQADPPDVAPIAEATRLPERDIYYLVFDRYGSDWSLMQRFGIENDIYADLEAAGFQTVPGARANYRATDFSLASTLSMDFLNDLSDSVGRDSSDRRPARDRLQHNEVGRFLRANGYRYYQLGAWYEATRTNATADEMLVWGDTPEFAAVMKKASILPTLERVLGLATSDTEWRDRHRNETQFAYRQIERLADTPERKFVFAHILQPHAPYAYDADGGFVFEAEEKVTPESILFEGQLRYTNERINELVAKLTEGPEEEHPIIVIAADEGPMVCGHVDCIDGSAETYGVRFGTLRAYYLPGLDYEVPADDSAVNIFRMLFREYFGADLPDLPNRSFDWPDNDHVYDFRDVTDELPLPGGPNAKPAVPRGTGEDRPLP